jgi:hypothetical protein
MLVRTKVYLDGAVAGIIGAAIIAMLFLFLDAVTRSLAYLFTRLPYWDTDFSLEQKISPRLKAWKSL